MAVLPEKAAGMTISFDSGFFANILSFSIDGISREAIETTHFGTAAPSAGNYGNKTYIPSDFSDAGSMTVEMQYDPDLDPPVDSAAETLTIEWPLADSGESTNTDWQVSAFMTDFAITGELEGLILATATIKFAGEVTINVAT